MNAHMAARRRGRLLAAPRSALTVEDVAVGRPLPSVSTSRQLAVPHAYPDGQHPPSSSSGHEDHPLAHAAASAVVTGTLPAGTATVTPSVLTTTDSPAPGEQLAEPQARPVWQQPPPDAAAHA